MGSRQKAAASKQNTVSSGNLNHSVSQEQLFTAGSIRGMSRADVLQVLGYQSKNTLNQLRVSLLKTSITYFVKTMSDEKVKEVVAHLKLPKRSQEKARCRAALVRHYLEHEEQQAQIRAILMASGEEVAGLPDAENQTKEAMEMDGEDVSNVDEEEGTDTMPPESGESPDEGGNLPEVAMFLNDFYPDENLARKMQTNFDQLRDYRAERLARVNAGNSSLDDMPPNPILEAGFVMHEPRSLKSTTTPTMVGGPKEFGGTKGMFTVFLRIFWRLFWSSHNLCSVPSNSVYGPPKIIVLSPQSPFIVPS